MLYVSSKTDFLLIVTTLAFQTTDILNRNACALAGFQLFVVFLENAVVVVACKLYFCLTVAVDTPAHRQGCELVHLIHILYGAVATLTLYLTNCYVL